MSGINNLVCALYKHKIPRHVLRHPARRRGMPCNARPAPLSNARAPKLTADIRSHAQKKVGALRHPYTSLHPDGRPGLAATPTLPVQSRSRRPSGQVARAEQAPRPSRSKTFCR
eukprot:scaffold219_cov126-Isochrysis_galbana.AAC.1